MDCPICSYAFDNNQHTPRLLKCGHTVCEECLNHILKENKVICPIDRDVTVAPSPKDLPKNFCILDVTHVPKSNLSVEQQCEKHKEEKLIRYCIDDNIGVCAECIIEHSGHKLVKLNDPILELRFEIKGLVQKMEEALQESVQQKQAIQQKELQINTATSQEIQSIENQFQQIMDLLESRKQELKKKVQQEANIQQQINEQECTEIQQYVQDINGQLNKINSINFNLNMDPNPQLQEQVIQFKREVLTLLTVGQKFKQVSLDPIQGIKIMFTNKSLEHEINKWGLITVGSALKNPAIFCFGTRNLVLKYNIAQERWSHAPILEDGGYDFKNFASIAALPNGSILITGGTKSADVFEFRDYKMVRKCQMLHMRSSHNAVYANGFVYCIGGYNGSSWHDKCEKICTRTFTSQPIASLNFKRCAFSSCVAQNYIYVFGGYDGVKYLDNIERYSILEDKWEVVQAQLNRPMQNTGAAYFGDNKIMISGGYNEKGTLNIVRCLNIETLEWSNLPPMMQTRYLMNKFHYCNGFVYAVGGSAAGQNIECYSVAENKWMQLKSYREFTDDTMYKWATIITHDRPLDS